VVEVGNALNVRIQASHVIQTDLTGVAHRPEIAIGQPFEVPNKIRPPISAADHSHHNWLFHSTLIARFEIFIAITAVCLIPLANKVFAMRAQM
jgi:hypothetical protein